MRAVIERVVGVIRLCERTLIVCLFLAMVTLYGFNVAVREIVPSFASEVAWIDELTRFLMIWVVFLALGVALERGRHVAITTFYLKLSGIPRRLARFLIDAVGFVFSIYLVWLSIEITRFVMQTGQESPTLNVPIFWIYVAPAIGFGLLALRFGLELIGVQNRHELEPRPE